MSNIIDKIQVSGVTYGIQGSGGTQTIELTQAEYDALVDKDPNTFYVITDAQAGDLTNYYTKSETNTLLGGKADTATTYTKTEVDNAITAGTSTKQDTLVSGTNIKTINNESLLGSGNIDIQGGGGGKAIEAGRGIAITTGETADIINCTLPISADSKGIYTTNNYPFEGSGYKGNNIVFGYNNKIYRSGLSTMSRFNLLCGNNNDLGDGEYTGDLYCNFVGGGNNKVYGTVSYSAVLGYKNSLRNSFETALGKYNVSNTGSTDADKTFFSIGNGTADNARHNAFEIRQNGDIYLNDGSKLQDTVSATTANTTALGGLKLVKLSQSEYDNLATKDNSTLYVIVN